LSTPGLTPALRRIPLDLQLPYATMGYENDSPDFSKYRGLPVRARFLGKNPDSQVENSPTLFATDRADRVTYIAHGWKVTDPAAPADIGPVPEHETLIEIPEDVLRMYVRRY